MDAPAASAADEFTMKLTRHNYGKARVRVLKVTRAGKTHSLKELEVQVMLHGDFEASYARADNRLVVATDSMKNIVNVLARQQLGAENEPFGAALGRHFLDAYRHVDRVEIRLREHCWSRIAVGGKPHPHAFSETSNVRPVCQVTATRDRTEIESGVEDLFVLKSTASAFADFLRDSFTTLPETADRILATRLKAAWKYARAPRRYSQTNRAIVNAMLKVFARNFSPSVQATLFEMGEAALQAAPEVSQVHLSMPNQHCLPVNLKPFGLDNANELFVPTDEPHGLIEGTVSR